MKHSASLRLAARKTVFFACVLCAFFPLFLFYVSSQDYHRIHGTTEAENGVLNVSGWDLTDPGGVPLDGTWEFFYGELTGGAGTAQTPACMIPVPLPWSHYQQDGVSLPKGGIASYRLRLTGCPQDRALTVYIPNLASAYRVYLNGTLVASRWDQAFGEAVPAGWDRGGGDELRTGITPPPSGVLQVVIEVKSSYIGGLYITPVLVDTALDAQGTELSRFLIAVYVGALLLCVTSFAVLFATKNDGFPSAALLVMDILLLLRILMMDGAFQVVSIFLPGLPSYPISAVLQSLTLFFPLVVLFDIWPLVHLEIGRNVRRLMLLYELVCGAAILLCALNGRPQIQHVLSTLGYLPTPYILYKLYRSVVQRVPYALIVSGILLFSMSGIIGANLNLSGCLRLNIDLFPPTCIVLAVLLQLLMNLRINRETQRRAQEAEALALQLRESRLTLTLSQIKPHFLYNTLIAIHMLCLQAPAEAAEAVLTFSDYLRANMRSISSDKPIPFTQELSHIESYVAIEQLRFGQRLTFRTELAETGFLLPPLTIQPIVENAIKHGACKNVTGGTVILRAGAVEDGWRVEVTDDGPGFDTSILDAPQSDSVGLGNIIFRLKEQMGARVTIESGQMGTTVVVYLPKEGAYAGDTH